MSKRDTARGIVVHDGRLLLIERWWSGRHYYSIPGGGIEPRETPEQTVVREVAEETEVNIEVERLVYSLTEEDGSRHLFFLCRYLSGSPKLPEDSEEARKTTEDNRFRPGWQPVSEIEKLSFGHWEAIHPQLVVDLSSGFGEGVKIITANASE